MKLGRQPGRWHVAVRQSGQVIGASKNFQPSVEGGYEALSLRLNLLRLTTRSRVNALQPGVLKQLRRPNERVDELLDLFKKEATQALGQLRLGLQRISCAREARQERWHHVVAPVLCCQ